MTNSLLLTNELETTPTGGRELLCKLNHDIMVDIFNNRLTVIELRKQPIRGIRSVISAFRGYIDGLSDETITKVFEIIKYRDIRILIVDGSNFGEIVRIVKKKFPQIHVYTFFHNVEARFFWGSFKQTKSVHALAVFCANYLAERKTVSFSDDLICLSKRDSQLLHKLYGRQGTHVSSMALRDQLDPNVQKGIAPPAQKFALFVGGIFYANLVGIRWFIKHVVPRIGIKICVVGKGFEIYKNQLEVCGKVEVIGAVNSLNEWYSNAHFVIAPIFDGSGMKTKVAEALMYGKRIIGTPEAFSGYEEIAGQVGTVCRTADEFVLAVEDANGMAIKMYDEDLRLIYVERFSYEAARSRMVEIVSSCECAL